MVAVFTYLPKENLFSALLLCEDETFKTEIYKLVWLLCCVKLVPKYSLLSLILLAFVLVWTIVLIFWGLRPLQAGVPLIVHWESTKSRDRASRLPVQMPAVSFICCVTLGKLLNFSLASYSAVKWGFENPWGWNKVIRYKEYIKCLEYCFPRRRPNINKLVVVSRLRVNRTKILPNCQTHSFRYGISP